MEAKLALEKLENLIDKFSNCEICYSYLVEAQECSQCHNLFCKTCVTSWFQSTGNRVCSSCRKPTQINHNIPIQRLVNQIPLTC